MVSKWAEKDIRALTYINPFFSEINPDVMVKKDTQASTTSHLNPSLESTQKSGSGRGLGKDKPVFPDTTSNLRNLYQEGIQNNYFVYNKQNRPYILRSGSIEFCMLDVTNPAARQWMKVRPLYYAHLYYILHIHTIAHIYMVMYSYTYTCSYKHTYIHTYIHTYNHIHILIYYHVYTHIHHIF